MSTLGRAGRGRSPGPARPPAPICKYDDSGLCLGVRRDG